jgi:hypothetical protein
MKWDEYNFIFIDFAYVIPILTIPLFSHYMYIKCFFLMTQKKRMESGFVKGTLREMSNW